MALLCEFERRELSSGVRRRADSVSHWMELDGAEVTWVSIWDGAKRSGAGGTSRIRAAWRYGTQREILAEYEDVVVIALGAAQMVLAALLIGRRKAVFLDACDSWALQFRYRAVGRKLSSVAALFGGMLQQLGSRYLRGVFYISERDLKADRRLVSGLTAVVVPQSVSSSLQGLPPVERVDRIVVPGDFTSFHNYRYLADVTEALARAKLRHPSLALEVSGVGSAEARIPPLFVRRGLVPDIADVYGGNTGVALVCGSGSGIPNRFLEAVATGRPVLLHTSLKYLAPVGGSGIYWFTGRGDVDEAVEQMCSYTGPAVAAPQDRLDGGSARSWAQATSDSRRGKSSCRTRSCDDGD